MVIRKITLDTTKEFPPTIKDKGETFYFVGGSMQYFKGDVDRIKVQLKKRNIKFRTVVVINPKGMGNWLIYVNKRNIHLNDLR